ncbi:MAG: aminopeptidase P family protein [Deltaproteobacteria bacterium]|nr:aminopeptidase P family protein [Deltaproteobacteria bacterium]MBW2069360.1 aminopeptidase P family protein [Deltaproteobacteria bacterium]
MLFEKSEILRRISKFQKNLNRRGIDLAIIHHLADVFYFTGTVENGYLVVPSEGEALLLVRRNERRAREATPVGVRRYGKSGELAEGILEVCGGTPRSVGVAMDVLPVSEYFFLQTKVLPGVKWEDVSYAIRLQRAVKSDAEIDFMKRAAFIAHRVYEKAAKTIKPGISEWELCALLEYEARIHGNLEVVRIRNRRLEITFGHVLSGSEAALPSYVDTPTGGPGVCEAFAQGSGNRVIQTGDFVIVDTMLNYCGYLNDQTRNFCVGRAPERLKRAFDVSVEMHEIFREMAVPGRSAGEVYDMLVAHARKRRLGEFFMGYGSEQVPFIGHGIGIEVDEFPFVARGQKILLDAGMTIAFEPKFIIPGEGVAGIENTYVITDSGAKSLAISPEELVQVG